MDAWTATQSAWATASGHVATATGLPGDACRAGVALGAVLIAVALVRYCVLDGNALFSPGRMPGDLYYSQAAEQPRGRNAGYPRTGGFTFSAPFATMAVFYWSFAFLSWVWNWGMPMGQFR